MSEQEQDLSPLLPHTSLNPTGSTTILLLHGGGSTRRSWDAVTTYLPPTYHLLIPDLPSHGQSASIPFSLQSSTRLLASLVTAKAHNSRAHIVGLSIGAYIAIDLAITHPALVSSVFVSGYNRFSPSPLTPLLSPLAWGFNKLPSLLPSAVTKFFLSGIDIATENSDSNSAPISYALHKSFFAILTSGTLPEPWKARTVIIAATKGGVVPSFDKPAVARELAEICRRDGNEDVRAVQHREMRHPWNWQDPRLFAEAVCCFSERRALPDGFEDV